MVVAVAAGLLSGAAAGIALERVGAVDPVAEPAPAIARADRVEVFDCPEGQPVASLSRGDRVLATGRSDDDRWLEIRSPVDLGSRAWVDVKLMVGDPGSTAIRSLPVHECGPDETTTTSTATSTSTTTTSTTTSTTSTTSTTLPPETTTTEPPTTTTTLPPNTPPAITNFTVSGPPAQPTQVHVDPHQSGSCPMDTTAHVDVQDPEGVSSVSVRWTTSLESGTVPMAAGVVPGWDLVFRFPQTAVPFNGPAEQPTFEVVVVDGQGVQSTTAVGPVTLTVFGFAQSCP